MPVLPVHVLLDSGQVWMTATSSKELCVTLLLQADLFHCTSYLLVDLRSNWCVSSCLSATCLQGVIAGAELPGIVSVPESSAPLLAPKLPGPAASCPLSQAPPGGDSHGGEHWG